MIRICWSYTVPGESYKTYVTNLQKTKNIKVAVNNFLKEITPNWLILENGKDLHTRVDKIKDLNRPSTDLSTFVNETNIKLNYYKIQIKEKQLYNYFNNILNNSVYLNSEFIKTVNDNFWDLLVK